MITAKIALRLTSKSTTWDDARTVAKASKIIQAFAKLGFDSASFYAPMNRYQTILKALFNAGYPRVFTSQPGEAPNNRKKDVLVQVEW